MCTCVQGDSHTQLRETAPPEGLPQAERGVVPGARMWLGSGESFEAARDLRVGILAAPGQVHSPSPGFPQTQSGTAVRLGGRHIRWPLAESRRV